MDERPPKTDELALKTDEHGLKPDAQNSLCLSSEQKS
jgi:hypothetical protein